MTQTTRPQACGNCGFKGTHSTSESDPLDADVHRLKSFSSSVAAVVLLELSPGSGPSVSRQRNGRFELEDWRFLEHLKEPVGLTPTSLSLLYQLSKFLSNIAQLGHRQHTPSRRLLTCAASARLIKRHRMWRTDRWHIYILLALPISPECRLGRRSKCRFHRIAATDIPRRIHQRWCYRGLI